MAVLAENHYGKSQVRLMKIVRRPEANDVLDWTLGVYLTGDFDACYREGDNTGILATDTMKNTVYAVARTSTAETLEAFALELAQFLAGRNPGVTSVRVTAEEKLWMRLKVPNEAGGHEQASECVSAARAGCGDDGRQPEAGCRARNDLRCEGARGDEDGRFRLFRLRPRRVDDPARNRRPGCLRPRRPSTGFTTHSRPTRPPPASA